MDGEEKMIDYIEYLDRVTKRAIDTRRSKEEEKKAQRNTLKKKENS